METIESLVSAVSTAQENKSVAFHVSATIIFSIVSGRPDRDILLERLSPLIGHWKEPLIKKLRKSASASYCKRAMMDFVARCSSRDELEPLLDSRNGVIASWAAEARGDGIIARAPSGGIEPLPGGLRFIETVFLDESDLQMIGKTASELGISPRELELMVFYIYSGYSMEHAIDITKNEDAEYIIQDVSMHLAGGDGRRILLSSYLIFSLRCRELGAGEKAEMMSRLWETVGQMDSMSAYSGRFFNEAYRLRAEIFGGPEH